MGNVLPVMGKEQQWEKTGLLESTRNSSGRDTWGPGSLVTGCPSVLFKEEGEEKKGAEIRDIPKTAVISDPNSGSGVPSGSVVREKHSKLTNSGYAHSLSQ